MPIYSYVCQECGDSHDHLISYAKREEPLPCSVEGCSGVSSYHISAPDIRTSDSASRLDDCKPAWYANWKEASKIRKEALNLSENKRDEHRKEVAARKETVNF